MLKLLDRDFRVAIIKLLQKIVLNSLETNEKIENSSKEAEEIFF